MLEFHPSTLLAVGVPAASGGVAGVVGVLIYRRLQQGTVRTGLARPFIALAVAVALSATTYAALRLVEPPGIGLTPGITLLIVVVPWVVFVARYVGFGQYVTPVRVVTGAVITGALIVVIILLNLVGRERLDIKTIGEETLQTLQIVQSVVFLGVLTLVFALIGGAIVTTYRHERLPTAQGVLVAGVPAAFVFAAQVTRPSTPLVNTVLTVGAFAAVATALALGVTRYDVVTRVPAIRRRGERAALTEADEAILVLDDRSRVVRVNELAERTFGDVDALVDMTDHSIGTLTERKTITCQTATGHRQFEPGVSPLVDAHDEILGYTLTLFDVTDREIRRQRLGVLNRILRHNVRNELDVIRAHAERADLDSAVDSVDRLAEISTEARRVQELVEQSPTDRTETALCPLVEAVVAEATAGSNADVTLAVPDATVSVDRERCRYALAHLVENAVEHNDSKSPRVVVRGDRNESRVHLVVADDGPGIPESERAVIEAGEEAALEHATGLGLWAANWAIQAAGGSLSFDESEFGGAAVRVTLPDVAADDGQ